MQNHIKQSITDKRQNKAQNLTWNYIGLKFMKKSNMSNLVENLGYIKCFSSSTPQNY